MAQQTLRPPGLLDDKRRIVSNRVMKDEVIFEKYSSETNGEYTEALVKLGAGGGNPLHLHKTFIETFSPVFGRLGLQLGKDVIYLENGQSISVPRGVPHKFFNDTEQGIQFRVRLTPGRPDFEKSIYIAYGLANDGLADAEGAPKHFLPLCLVAAYGDITLAGFAGTLMKPLIILGAWYARVSGVEDELIHRYFR